MGMRGDAGVRRATRERVGVSSGTHGCIQLYPGVVHRGYIGDVRAYVGAEKC